MTSNFSNTSNINNNSKNNINTNINVTYSIDEFAKKLRMEKYDLIELKKLKNEAIENEKNRKKKKFSALKIQACFRGYLFRAEFKQEM